MHARFAFIFVTILAFWVPFLPSEEIPRTLVALTNLDYEPDVTDTFIHKCAEMPLNYLGYHVEYHDIRQGLPKIVDRPEVLGVITWFNVKTAPDDPYAYLEWAINVARSGRKFVIFDVSGFEGKGDKQGPSQAEINHFWKYLGLQSQSKWFSRTYNATVSYADPMMVDFERSYRDLASFSVMYANPKKAKAHLSVKLDANKSQEADLVVTSPQGGYVAGGYGVFHYFEPDLEVREWYINPFQFFSKAVDQNEIPKADVTTLCGRRMYYSHIDGDGWISLSQVRKYLKQRALCADVIYHEVLKGYPDLPCSVGPIGADVELSWVGSEESRSIAREIFKLPNIEVATHTLSHPLDWGFFEDYHADYERPYLAKYAHGSWEEESWVPSWNTLVAMTDEGDKEAHFKYSGQKIAGAYEVPRAYGNKVYNLRDEIQGGIEASEALAPEGKKTNVVLWSGNCRPFNAAIALARKLGVPNLNGGDSRFDVEYPSYGWVSAIGRQVGDQRQVYACNSNENTYTDLWMSRFYGFNRLPETFKNTESPVRLKAMNLYYHMYSGELTASLNALHNNIAFIESQEIIPVTASQYAKIGDGFYSTVFDALGENSWKVLNRGGLQTVRFDRCTFKAVDLPQSSGVLGQRHHQGSLYVALDPAVEEPVITLRKSSECSQEPRSTLAYLIESRWDVSHLQRHGPAHFAFQAQGFGSGEMAWFIPEPGRYRITVRMPSGNTKAFEHEATERKITLDLGRGAEEYPYHVEIKAL